MTLTPKINNRKQSTEDLITEGVSGGYIWSASSSESKENPSIIPAYMKPLHGKEGK